MSSCIRGWPHQRSCDILVSDSRAELITLRTIQRFTTETKHMTKHIGNNTSLEQENGHKFSTSIQAIIDMREHVMYAECRWGTHNIYHDLDLYPCVNNNWTYMAWSFATSPLSDSKLKLFPSFLCTEKWFPIKHMLHSPRTEVGS